MQLPFDVLGIAPVAQWHPGPHGPGPHGPHWGGSYWGTGSAGLGFGMGGGWWVVLLLVVLLAAIAVVLVLSIRSDGDGERATDDPVALLRERYAAGDLDDEEFERRLSRLQKTG